MQNGMLNQHQLITITKNLKNSSSWNIFPPSICYSEFSICACDKKSFERKKKTNVLLNKKGAFTATQAKKELDGNPTLPPQEPDPVLTPVEPEIIAPTTDNPPAPILPEEGAISEKGSLGLQTDGNLRSPTFISERTGTTASDDIDSYYIRRNRHSRRSVTDYPTYYDDIRSNLPSPISLHDPKQLQRRIERQKRSLSQSQIQQTGPKPVATRFRDRTSTAVYEDDNDENDLPYPHRGDPARLANDGFAERAKEWRNLKEKA